MNVTESLRLFLPELFLLSGAFLIVLLDLAVQNKKALGALSLVTLAGTMLLARNPDGTLPLFFGAFSLDSFTHFFRLLILGGAFLTALVLLAYKALPREQEGEAHALLLFLTFALILMAASTNLLMIFLSVEFVSILSYLLTGFLKKNPAAKEAALKYFLFGSLCSAIMLYGISLLYGASGSLDLFLVEKALKNNPSFFSVSVFSMLFFLTGLGFKTALVPFHMWAPDVYEAAPTPIAGFLTVVPKAVGFAVLIRILSTVFMWIGWKWQPLLILLAMATMTTGNMLAISQTSVKRLLAYSTIAQAGYILMGLAVFNGLGLTGVLVYLAAYAFTNLGAFTVVTAVSNELASDEIGTYSGLARRSPFLAFSLTIFLLSLAGLPPLAGFIGKFYVFSAALEAGFVALAVTAAVNSAVAAFYYFKIVRQMYLTAPVHSHPFQPHGLLLFALGVLLAGTFLIGLYPPPLIDFVRHLLML